MNELTMQPPAGMTAGMNDERKPEAMTAAMNDDADDEKKPAALLAHHDSDDVMMEPQTHIAGTYRHCQNDDEEEKHLEEHARIHFMDGHNTSPAALAQSMFPFLFLLDDETELSSLTTQVIKSEKQSNKFDKEGKKQYINTCIQA